MKIRSRKQMIYIGKFCFAYRTFQLWNQLSANALGTLCYKQSNYRNKVRKMINKHSELRWNGVISLEYVKGM
jgi:hypothetical protein